MPDTTQEYHHEHPPTVAVELAYTHSKSAIQRNSKFRANVLTATRCSQAAVLCCAWVVHESCQNPSHAAARAGKAAVLERRTELTKARRAIQTHINLLSSRQGKTAKTQHKFSHIRQQAAIHTAGCTRSLTVLAPPRVVKQKSQ